MIEVGRKGKKKGREEGKREERNKRGGEGEELILFASSERLTARWHGCVWRQAGERCDPAEGCSVFQRCCSYNLIVSPVPQSASSVPSRVSLPLKRFFSLPHLNWRQLNTQMYYSSLGCWRGNIFWKIWQLSITAQRNWRKEGLQRRHWTEFLKVTLRFCVTFQSDILRLKKNNKQLRLCS